MTKVCYDTTRIAYGLLALAALFLPAIGCGSDGPAMTRVTGNVTLNGQPVPEGQIIFRSQDGATVSAAGKVVDGVYEFDAIPGPKAVFITAYREVPGKFDQSNPGEKVQVTEQYIPEEYNRRSKLSINVNDSSSTFDFALTTS